MPVHVVPSALAAVLSRPAAAVFASSFFARLLAGKVSDARGAHISVVAGLLHRRRVLRVRPAPGPRPPLALGFIIAGLLLTGVTEAFS